MKRLPVVIVVAILFWLPGVANAMLFDRISAGVGSGGYGFDNLYEDGEQVTLGMGATTALVSSFSVVMDNPNTAIKINFYTPNSNGSPDSKIWSSSPIAGASGLITVNVPNVLVPKEFIWTVEQPLLSATGLIRAGISDVVGTSDVLWLRGPNGWSDVNWGRGTYGFAVQIDGTPVYAPVPIPGALLLFAPSLIGLVLMRRRLRK
jgi:hypothetical protein